MEPVGCNHPTGSKSLDRQTLARHTAPGSKTEEFARRLAESGKPLLTLDIPANGNLVGIGTEVMVVMVSLLKDCSR